MGSRIDDVAFGIGTTHPTDTEGHSAGLHPVERPSDIGRQGDTDVLHDGHRRHDVAQPELTALGRTIPSD